MLSKKPFQLQTCEPKPRTKLCKNVFEKYLTTKPIEIGKTSKMAYIKDVITKDNTVDKDNLI